MKYWFDTEFMEDGKTIDLLSIGIVAEDGREMYAVNEEADLSKANEWVKENVLPHLRSEEMLSGGNIYADIDSIKAHIVTFVYPVTYGKPEFWAYYADYDWVVLCQLFGTMMDLPDGWPMFCMDIKQLCVSMGDPQLPKDPENEHHALADARWNRKAWEFLMAPARDEEIEKQPGVRTQNEDGWTIDGETGEIRTFPRGWRMAPEFADVLHRLDELEKKTSGGD